MMNPDATRQTAAESMSQVSSYFQAVDNAVLMGDTNKRYRHSTNGCYAPSIPVHANSYTTLVISPAFDNTCDLWNSYIYCTMNAKVTIPEAYPTSTYWGTFTGTGTDIKYKPRREPNPFLFWVGFRDAFDAIEKYEIVANRITKYTQNSSPEESFITSSCIPDHAAKNDHFSRVRHKDIWNHKYTSGNGVFIDPSPYQGFNATTPTTQELKEGKTEFDVTFFRSGSAV